MATHSPRELKTQAQKCLESTRNNTRKLVLIYTVTLVILSLAANGLNLYLSNQISGTGGLAGVGIRSILQTLQEVITYFHSLFTPFWQIGFLYTVICNARQEKVEYTGMFFGFRRIRRILGHFFAQLLIYLLVLLLVTQLASNLFLMTPYSDPFVELLTPLIENGSVLDASGAIVMDALPMEQLAVACLPFLILCILIIVPVCIFLSYCFRMSTYLLVQGPEIGGMASLRLSWRLMKGHKWEIMKLDLSYWWYYGLGILATIVGYLDMILPMLGITLPFNETVAYFASLILYGLMTIGLYVWKKWEVDTAYVLAFEAIAHPETEA